MRSKRVIARFVALEYAALLGSVLFWFQLAVHLGPRTTAILIAANLCTLAALGLTTAVTLPSVRRRRGAPIAVWRATRRKAWLVEGAMMIAGLVTLFAIVAAYAGLGRNEIVLPAIIQALGLPARYSGPAREWVRYHRTHKLFRAWSGALLVMLVLFGGGGEIAAAAALAGREWLALFGISLLPARGEAIRRPILDHVPALSEFANSTAHFSFRRMSYHVGKSLLGMLVGPMGSVIARTGRGMRLRTRSTTPNPWSIMVVRLIAVGTTAGALVVVALVKGPGALVASASLLRIGSVAASAAFWNHFASYGSHYEAHDDGDE